MRRIIPVVAVVAVVIAYSLFYLWMIGDLSIHSQTGWGWRSVPDWTERLTDRRGPFLFEPTAQLGTPVGTWLVSPVNSLIAVGLGGLLGGNLLVWHRRRQLPVYCQPGRSGRWSALASIPALLAGGACCAPALLLVIATPSIGFLAGLFPWLVPLSAALLAGTLTAQGFSYHAARQRAEQRTG